MWHMQEVKSRIEILSTAQKSAMSTLKEIWTCERKITTANK
jgi:hypothetical protein